VVYLFFVHIQQNRPYRRHPGSPGHAEHIGVGIPKAKIAEGADNADRLLFFQLAVHVSGRDAVRHEADQEFQRVFIRGFRRNRVSSLGAFFDLLVGRYDELQVLTGFEVDCSVFGQPDPKLFNVIGHILQALDRAIQLSNGEQFFRQADPYVGLELDLAREADVVFDLLRGHKGELGGQMGSNIR